MAAFSVTVDATRIKDFENATGVFSIGGGQSGAAEPSAPYQGTNDYNRRLSDTTFNGRGFYYDPTADGQGTFDLTSLGPVMVKVNVSDYGGLNLQNPIRVRLGSGSSAYHDAIVIGTDSLLPSFREYPAVGGYVILPVDLSIAAYRNSTSGSPNLAAARYFGFVYRFTNSQAKSENCFASAIDSGSGMSAVGGDGANDPGSWVNFPEADEGDNVNGRYGFATRYKEKIFAYGKWNVGDGITPTEFNGLASESVTWLDGLFGPGWSGPSINLSRNGDVFSDASTHDSSGTTSVSDTRADYSFVGNVASAVVTHTLNNFRNYNMTSSVTCSGNVEIESISLNGGTILNAIVRCNAAINSGVLVDPDFSKVSRTSFRQTGTAHAIVITTPGTYTLTDLSFQGFGGAFGSNLTPSSGPSDAAIYNLSGGLVTINQVDGTGITVRNGPSATTVIQNTKSVTFNLSFAGDDPSNFEWRLYEDDPTPGTIGTVELDGLENETSNVLVYSFNHSSDVPVTLQIIADGFIERLFKTTLVNQNTSFEVEVFRDFNL